VGCRRAWTEESAHGVATAKAPTRPPEADFNHETPACQVRMAWFALSGQPLNPTYAVFPKVAAREQVAAGQRSLMREPDRRWMIAALKSNRQFSVRTSAACRDISRSPISAAARAQIGAQIVRTHRPRLKSRGSTREDALGVDGGLEHKQLRRQCSRVLLILRCGFTKKRLRGRRRGHRRTPGTGSRRGAAAVVVALLTTVRTEMAIGDHI